MNTNPFAFGPCPVCGSDYLTYLRDVRAVRLGRDVPLRVCLHCRSFTCAAGYVEGDQELRDDAQYHTKFIDQKTQQYRWLLDMLRRGDSLADVGCGIGTLCNAAKGMWPTVVGYDINPHAIECGKKLFPGLDLRYGPFGYDGAVFDTVTVVDTLEHIAEPIPFIQTVVSHLSPGGFLYITVPLLDEDKYHWLAESKEKDGSPFADCAVHVTHFSRPGLVMLCEHAGLRRESTTPQGWPRDGELFFKP